MADSPRKASSEPLSSQVARRGKIRVPVRIVIIIVKEPFQRALFPMWQTAVTGMANKQVVNEHMGAKFPFRHVMCITFRRIILFEPTRRYVRRVINIEDQIFTVSGSSGLGLPVVKTVLKETGYIAMLDLKKPDASSFGPASSSDRFSESDITQAEDITKVVERSRPVDERNRLAARGNDILRRRRDTGEGISSTGTFNLTRFAVKFPPEGPDGERWKRVQLLLRVNLVRLFTYQKKAHGKPHRAVKRIRRRKLPDYTMAKAAELNDDHETIFYPLYVMILNYWFPADDGCQPSLSLEMRYTYTASAVWRKILSGGQVPPSTQGLIGKLSHYKQTPIPTFPISHRLGLDHIPSEIKWQGDSLGVSTTAHASRSGRRRPQKARPEYTRANRNPEDGSPTPTPFPSTKQKAKRKVLIIDDVEAAGAEEKRKLRKDDAGCLYMWSGDCS
ncbi:hypothetical protein V8E53_011349 [Lactarius tabidus]